jgi:flagellin
MIINTNVTAIQANNNLTTTENNLNAALNKLSSGYQINNASDNAAGLVESQSLQAEIGGTNQAISNAQQGVNFVQTADGSLNEVESMLQIMQTLAVSAANSATTNGSAQQAEITQLTSEIDAMGQSTQFSGTQVFQNYAASTASALDFQVGAGAGGANQLSFAQNLAIDSTTTSGLFSVQLSSVDVTTNAGATSAIATLNSAINDVSTARAALGATANRLQDIVAGLSVASENLTASQATITNTDMSAEMVQFTTQQIMAQAGVAMLAQANQTPQYVLKLLG